MSCHTNPLDDVRVASPCPADWDAMVGGDRVRFCGQCQLNVYNLSGMSRREAEALVTGAEGRLCVRFYRRADGSVLTRDCPVGLRALKRRASRVARATLSAALGFLSGLGLNLAWGNGGRLESREMGSVPFGQPAVQVKPARETPVKAELYPGLEAATAGQLAIPVKQGAAGGKRVRTRRPRAGR